MTGKEHPGSVYYGDPSYAESHMFKYHKSTDYR